MAPPEQADAYAWAREHFSRVRPALDFAGLPALLADERGTLLDYQAEDLVGSRAYTLLRIPEEIEFVAGVLSSLRALQPWEGPVSILGGGDRVLRGRLLVQPVASPQGKPAAYLAMARLGEGHGAGEAAGDSGEEAFRHFANGMAHRFNNLLAGIMGQTELMLASGETPAHVQVRGQKILAATANGQEWISKLMGFTRRQPGRFRTVDAAPIVRHAERRLRERGLPGIQLEVDAPESVLPVQADSNAINTILENLLANALEAMSASGGMLIIRLEERMHALDEEAPPVPCVVLSVADTGPGIEPAVAANMFAPFYSTKDMAEALGMGLPVVAGAVRRHGGRLEYDTIPDEGTTFRVFLPVDRGAVRRNPEPGQGETILFHDPEPAIAETAQAQLEALGYRLTRADSPAHACELLAAGLSCHALVVSADSGPAGLPGLIEQAAVRGLPVLLTCDSSAEPPRLPGVTRALSKPCTLSAFARALRETLGHPPGG